MNRSSGNNPDTRTATTCRYHTHRTFKYPTILVTHMVRFVEDDAVSAECQEGRSRLRGLLRGLLRLRGLRRRFFHRNTTVGRNHDINGATTTRRRLGRSGPPLDTVTRHLQNHTTFSRRAVKHKYGQIGLHTGINNRALDLSDPLRDERHWHNNKCASIRSQVRENKTHHHDCFAETHFVGDDAAAHHAPRRSHRFTAQTKLHTFALVCLRLQTRFAYIFVKHTYSSSIVLCGGGGGGRLLLLHHDDATTDLTVFLFHFLFH